MTEPLSRMFTALGLSAVTAFGLFWVMQMLISVDYKPSEPTPPIPVNWVRLRIDTEPEIPPRPKPDRKKPEPAPAPPQVSPTSTVNPSEAVDNIIPIPNPSEAAKDATDPTIATGTDSDVTPLVRVDPDYPPRAKQQGIQGWVELRFTITPAGTVADPVVTAANPSFIFDRAALQAVRRWRYSPKRENGVPVARTGVEVRLRFELEKSRR